MDITFSEKKTTLKLHQELKNYIIVYYNEQESRTANRVDRPAN